MPTSMPTRLLASPGGHPANATPWLESTPHPLYARRSLLIHPKGAPDGTRCGYRHPISCSVSPIGSPRIAFNPHTFTALAG